MSTIPFPHVSWLQLAAPPVPTRALKNIIIQEFDCDNLNDAIAAVRAPEPAPFPREEPPEPDEPVASCLKETTPWHFTGNRISPVQGAIRGAVHQQAAAGPYATVGSNSTKRTTSTCTAPTQERPPPHRNNAGQKPSHDILSVPEFS